MSRRERINLIRKPYQVFRFAGKHYAAALVITVEKRSDAYRVSRGYVAVLRRIINNHCKLGVKHFKHFNAVFFIERKQNFAIGIADKGVFL